MNTLYETKNYAFAWDNLMGVCRFIRQSDGAVSPLFCGEEAKDVKEILEVLMTENVGPNEIPPGDFLDGIAMFLDYE